MAVTKAQLVVWALIAGFSAAGYSVLSRVKAPDGLPASVPVAQRIPTRDIVRGFALLGILIMNMPGFSASFYAEADGSHL